MNTKLRNHVEILFAAAPKTPRAAEMKEELLANLNEKYDDLLREGYDLVTAFHIALSGIGDIDELFSGCSSTEKRPLPRAESIPVAMPVLLKPRPSRMPLYLGIAFGLTVLAPAFVPFWLFCTGNVGVGVFCMFLSWGIAGSIIVYAIASLFTKGSRQAEELYQRQLLSQGEKHGLSQEFVQNELRGISRTNKLRQIVFILIMIFLIWHLFLNVTGIVPHGIRFHWPHAVRLFDWGITPTGPVITQERELGDDFTTLDIHSAISVEFKRADHNSVTVETHEDMMPFITTKIQNGTLLIVQNSSKRFRNVKKLHVTVYSTNIPQLFNVSGASRLVCSEPLKTESVSLYGSGASKLQFTNLESTNLNLKADGASSIEVAGKAESVHLQASGASKLRASNLEADQCDITLSGASNADFGVISKELSVRASGASRLDYQGSPAIKKQEITGASKIRPRY